MRVLASWEANGSASTTTRVCQGVQSVTRLRVCPVSTVLSSQRRTRTSPRAQTRAMTCPCARTACTPPAWVRSSPRTST